MKPNKDCTPFFEGQSYNIVAQKSNLSIDFYTHPVLCIANFKVYFVGPIVD